MLKHMSERMEESGREENIRIGLGGRCDELAWV